MKIIEGRLLAGQAYSRKRENIANLYATKGIKEGIAYLETIQGDNENNGTSKKITTYESIKKALSIDIYDVQQDYGKKFHDDHAYQFIRNIKSMYTSFEKIMREKYSEEISDDAIKASFSIYVLGAYKSISENAVKESEQLMNVMQKAGHPINGLTEKNEDGRDAK